MIPFLSGQNRPSIPSRLIAAHLGAYREPRYDNMAGFVECRPAGCVTETGQPDASLKQLPLSRSAGDMMRSWLA
jgi:hypothetical protein